MWRLIGSLAASRAFKSFQASLELAVDRFQQISIGIVVAQAALLLAVFGVGFCLVGLFFYWSNQPTYVPAAFMAAGVAFVPSLICFWIARSLFRRS